MFIAEFHSYWTGYFTSRPSLKLYERETNNLLQFTKQISVLFENTDETREDINALKRAMGAMQHHDAVTGTEKEAVAHDYALRLRYVRLI